MKKVIEVPRGKDTVGISVSGHSHVRLLDSNGAETFRFQSPGEHITAVVRAGSYTVETDGKLGKIDLTSTERLKGAEFDAMKPPAGGARPAGATVPGRTRIPRP
jgi:hypothetical protein